MQVQCLTNRLNTKGAENNEIGSNIFLHKDQKQISIYASTIFTSTYKKGAIPKS